MTSIADGSVDIQMTSEPNISIPSWFGEVVLISRYLQKHNVLNKFNGQVRFARKRFGRYEVVDFLVVLAGLCHQWRAHAGGVLRATSAVRRPRTLCHLARPGISLSLGIQCALVYSLPRARRTSPRGARLFSFSGSFSRVSHLARGGLFLKAGSASPDPCRHLRHPSDCHFSHVA
jgi:hypothetical protein